MVVLLPSSLRVAGWFSHYFKLFLIPLVKFIFSFINVLHVSLKMQANELKRLPTQSELFRKTHTRKTEKTWVDPRSENAWVYMF